MLDVAASLAPRIRRLADVTSWLSHAQAVIHPLRYCPPLRQGTRYALVTRDTRGRRMILGSGMALNSHQPLNLAVVRQRGAKLGAREVIVVEPVRSLHIATMSRRDAELDWPDLGR